MAEYLACPKCGNRVDQDDDETGETTSIPAMRKTLRAATVDWPRQVVVPYCPHCGTVLGVLAPKQ